MRSGLVVVATRRRSFAWSILVGSRQASWRSTSYVSQSASLPRCRVETPQSLGSGTRDERGESGDNRDNIGSVRARNKRRNNPHRRAMASAGVADSVSRCTDDP